MPDSKHPRIFSPFTIRRMVPSLVMLAAGTSRLSFIEGWADESRHRPLDIVTGTGNTVLSRTVFGHIVTMTDIPPEILKETMALAATGGLTVTPGKAPAEDFPLADDHGDRVPSPRAPDHLNDDSRLIAEAWRVLIPGDRPRDVGYDQKHRGNPLADQLRTPRRSLAAAGLESRRMGPCLNAAGCEDLCLRISDEPPTFAEGLAPVAGGDGISRATRSPICSCPWSRGYQPKNRHLGSKSFAYRSWPIPKVRRPCPCPMMT